MKKFEANGIKYFAVDLPKGASGISISEPTNINRGIISNSIQYRSLKWEIDGRHGEQTLPNLPYEILGLVKELTPTQMSDLLVKGTRPNSPGVITYKHDVSCLFSTDNLKLGFSIFKKQKELTSNTLIIKIL